MTETPNVRLESLIARVERHQAALGKTDERFVGKYQRFLGSSKTWTHRLKARAFTDLNVGKWIEKLTAMVTELDGAEPDAIVFADMPFTRQLTALISRLEGQTNDRRCVVALAPTGCGKSLTAKHEAATSGGESVYVHATEWWKHSESQMCCGLAKALGVTQCVSSSRCFTNILDGLKAQPRTVLIDDAHEGGVSLMRHVRTLIDESKGRFVLLAYPTEWDRVRASSGGAIDECNQLFGRCIKPVFDSYRGGIQIDDVACYLKRATALGAESRVAAQRITPALQRNGNLRTLQDALEEAEAECDETGQELTIDTLVRSIDSLCPTSNKIVNPVGRPR